MKRFINNYPICFFLIFVSFTFCTQNQSTNVQLPSSFYGKWYSTDGKNVWGFHITQDFFRTNNIHFKYLQVFKDVDYYTVEIGLGTERRTYLLKEVQPGYILISGTERNFKLYKNNPDKPNTYSSSLFSKTENMQHNKASDNRIKEKRSSELPSSFYGKWYSTDGKNVWGFHITQDFFRTNNIHFKYLQVFKDVDYYTVEIGLGTERRTYLLKEVQPGYILISGTERNFKLYKNNPDKPNTYSSSLFSKTENMQHNKASDNRIKEKRSSELLNNTSLYIKSSSWNYGSCFDHDYDDYKSTCCLTIDIRAKELGRNSDDKYSGYYELYYKKSYKSNYRHLFTSETYTNIRTLTFGFFRCVSIGYGAFPLKHGEYDFRSKLFDEEGILQEVRNTSMAKNLNNQKFELFYGTGKGEEKEM